jgi:N6-L-threonylcarbamoyladenine synthase
MAKRTWILGLESSCDETAAALVDERGEVASSIIASQVDIHHPYGGVVPELASRHHILNICSVTNEALRRATLSLSEVNGIAVTSGPGLVGALLVGIQFAKALAWTHGKPLLAVDHLLAHLEAPYLHERTRSPAERRDPGFPHVALLVSGGHTVIGVRSSPLELQVLGATRDDAAGEAFDKLSKLLGLGYPGGRRIDELGAAGDPRSIAFPRALRGRGGWDFSFSGLKTAVKHHVEKQGLPDGLPALRDLCASFQAAVVDVLVERVVQAVHHSRIHCVVVAGGVAANSALRRALGQAAVSEGFALFVPPLAYCTDNAAMVALAGQRLLSRRVVAGLDLNASATWKGWGPG